MLLLGSHGDPFRREESRNADGLDKISEGHPHDFGEFGQTQKVHLPKLLFNIRNVLEELLLGKVALYGVPVDVLPSSPKVY